MGLFKRFSCFWVVAVRTVFTMILATITAFQMVVFRIYDETFLTDIIILGF